MTHLDKLGRIIILHQAAIFGFAENLQRHTEIAPVIDAKIEMDLKHASSVWMDESCKSAHLK